MYQINIHIYIYMCVYRYFQTCYLLLSILLVTSNMSLHHWLLLWGPMLLMLPFNCHIQVLHLYWEPEIL